MVHHPKGVDVLPSPNVLNGATSGISPEAIERTVRFLAGVYEDVIIDCAREVSDLNLAAIRCCEALYLVATPDVAALRDLTRYIDRLLQCNVPANMLRVVINRYSKEAPLTLEQIEKAVHQQVSITIPNSSAELAKAVNTGMPDRRPQVGICDPDGQVGREPGWFASRTKRGRTKTQVSLLEMR